MLAVEEVLKAEDLVHEWVVLGVEPLAGFAHAGDLLGGDAVLPEVVGVDDGVGLPVGVVRDELWQ